MGAPINQMPKPLLRVHLQRTEQELAAIETQMQAFRTKRRVPDMGLLQHKHRMVCQQAALNNALLEKT